jgi:hypothetical protein
MPRIAEKVMLSREMLYGFSMNAGHDDLPPRGKDAITGHECPDLDKKVLHLLLHSDRFDAERASDPSSQVAGFQ